MCPCHGVENRPFACKFQGRLALFYHYIIENSVWQGCRGLVITACVFLLPLMNCDVRCDGMQFQYTVSTRNDCKFHWLLNLYVRSSRHLGHPRHPFCVSVSHRMWLVCAYYCSRGYVLIPLKSSYSWDACPAWPSFASPSSLLR